MKLDPKVRNLIIFLFQNVVIIGISAYFLIYILGETDILRLIGICVLAVIAWRGILSVYRRMIQPPKHPLKYGLIINCFLNLSLCVIDF
jgi:hypothetical protein